MRVLARVLFFGCVALLLFAQAMQRPLDHDEHQFVASGWLIARAGLLPYRDFPYFHLPNLSLLYALPFLFTNHLLLAARLVSVGAALLSAWLIFRLLHREDDDWSAFALGTAAALLWVLNPISQYASGLAWNHDTPLLFCLLAFAIFVRNAPTRRDYFLSGLCIAIAIGMRATFALGIAAFAVVALFERESKSIVLAWGSGLSVGLLPALLFFALAPAQFIFGNITYAALNTQWRLEHEYERAMTLSDKFSYLMTDVIGWSSTLAIVLAFVLVMILSLRRWRTPTLPSPPSSRTPQSGVGEAHPRPAEGGQAKPTSRACARDIGGIIAASGRGFWLAVALSIALFVSAFLPTPTFQQYFFSAVPFIILTIGLACRELMDKRIGAALMIALACIALPQGLPLLQRIPIIFSPEQWTTVQTHQVGAWILERTGRGSVVTLAPLFPLEADLPIYPELATGPFAYRVGTLISADERQRQHIFSSEEISAVLDRRPPRAIFLGFEPEELEEPLVDYARPHKFVYQRLPNGKNLWVAP